MPSSVVSSKGQIVIPKEVREIMGIKQGSRVYFDVDEQGNVRLRRGSRSLRDLAGFIKWDGPPVTLEDMDRAIAEAAAERAMRT